MTMPATYTFDKTIPKVTGGNAWCVAQSGVFVFVGGSFTGLGGLPRVNLACFNLITKAVTPFSPITGFAPIVDMLVLNGVLYISSFGPIQTVAGPLRNYVAAFDVATGALLPWDPNANSPVKSIETDGVSMLLGGSFTTLGGGAYARNGLARVDAATGVPDAYAPSINGTAESLAWDPASSSLFAVGSFSQADATARNNAARFDAAGALMPWNPNLNGQGNSIAIRGGLAYVAGFFGMVNGATTRYGLAVFDTATGTVDPQSFGITSSSSGYKLAFSPANNLLYVGGAFGTIQGTEPDGLVVFDPATGLLNPPATSFNSPVIDLVFSATYVVCAGFFSVFTGNQQFPMFGSFPYGTTNFVNPGTLSLFGMHSMVFDPAGIIYGGFQFSTATGLNGTFARNGLVAFDLSGNVLPWNPVLSFGASSVTVYKVIRDPSTGYIYVGGAFSSANATARQGFAVFNAAGTLLPLDLALDRAPFVAEVRDMFIDATHIYIVGMFSHVNGGMPKTDIARFDKLTGVYDATWTPTVSPTSLTTNQIFAMDSDGTYIYIGGTFAQVTGQPRANLARIPIAGAGAPDAGWVFDADSEVSALALDGSGNLYAGGSFSNINATPAGKSVSRILAGGILDPSFGLALGLTIATSVAQILVYGPDIFIAWGGDTAGTTYVGGMFGASSAGALNWFQPRVLGGSQGGFLVAAGRIFFSGGYFDIFTQGASGGLAAFYSPALPDTTLPRPPKIRFLNRRPQNGAPALTMMRWDPISRDVSGNPTTVTSYRVYRTASKNLEDPALVAEVTTLDIKGDVDTLFIEEIDGYFRYCVSGVNAAGEGGKSCANFATTEQLERLS